MVDHWGMCAMWLVAFRASFGLWRGVDVLAMQANIVYINLTQCLSDSVSSKFYTMACYLSNVTGHALDLNHSQSKLIGSVVSWNGFSSMTSNLPSSKLTAGLLLLLRPNPSVTFSTRVAKARSSENPDVFVESILQFVSYTASMGKMAKRYWCCPMFFRQSHSCL